METDVHIKDEIMSIKQACNYLKISKGTLKKLPIKRIHIRRRILYSKSALTLFIKENTRES
jgi:hypothetical protein